MNVIRCAVLAGSFSLFGLASAPQAVAGCALPPPILFAPASKTRLPPEPTIYLFVLQNPSYGHGKLDEIAVVDGQGLPLAHERETLPGTHDVQVLRFHVKAKRGEIVFRVRTGEGVSQKDTTATYRIDAKWRPPQPPPLTKIVEATYTYDEGCAPSNGFVLKIEPPAPAYRVTGDGQEWVVPGDDGWREGKVSTGEVLTGRIGCSDFVIPTEKPLTLKVTSLFSNGQEGEPLTPGCAPSKGDFGPVCGAPVWLHFSGRVKSMMDDR
jgi:hypothetical protein